MKDDSAKPADDRQKLVPAARPMPAIREPYGQLGPYLEIPDAPADFRRDILEYWRILNKRKWVIMSVLAAFVVLGGLKTLMETPIYTATVRLQIERSASKIVEGGSVTPTETADGEFLRTQYALLQSRALAERVVSVLQLGEDADLLQKRGFSFMSFMNRVIQLEGSSGVQDPVMSGRDRVAAVGIILGNRAVRPVAGSRLVDIEYSDPVPWRAQKVVMAFADAFIASNLDKRFEANAYAKAFLEDQVKQLKLRLEEFERILLDFAQQKQIVALGEKSLATENKLVGANTTLGNLVAERIKNEQLWKQVATADAVNLPQFLSNKTIEGLREKRNLLTSEYNEKLETFQPSYPTMVQIKYKITEIERQLAAEVRAIRESLKAAFENSKSQEMEMKKQIEILKDEVLDLQKRSIEYNILKREVDSNRSLYEGLLQRYKEVDVAGGVGTNNVFVIDKAELPGSASSPRMGQALLLSLALGLGVGLGAAYVLEILDDTVRSIEEIERVTGLVTLGVIPHVPDGSTAEQEISDPGSGLSEAYRSLCTSLQFATDSGLPSTLFVTSSGPREGKSVTSRAIATQFATMGLKVLLIDADLRNPSLHKSFNVDNSIGLSNYLTGSCNPPDTFHKTSIANMALMSSGPLPPNAADLLAGPRLHTLFSVGLEVFDLIVVDGPPVLGLADAPLVSSASAATIFLVAAGQTRTGLARGALKRLQYARNSVIGTVLTKYDSKSGGYAYEYAYKYGRQESGPRETILKSSAQSPQLPKAREGG